MALRYFGTDGVRGKAGSDLTEGFARALGRAAGLYLVSTSARSFGGRRGVVAVGHDTRISSPELAIACAEGLASAGADVLFLGTVPTATVAYAVSALDLAGGCVVSASHNPPEDNGIKFFGAGGYKLSEAQEESIEHILEGRTSGDGDDRATGTISDELAKETIDRYKEHVLLAVGSPDLGSMRAVLDCANGAAFVLGPQVLCALGADILAIAADGDGSKINVACGATNPYFVASETEKSGCGLGVAFDGDADRLVAVDGSGNIYDGDQLMAAFARWMLEDGRLDPPVVVATVMSNLGLKMALADLGVKLVECGVGDRQVVESMRSVGAKLGGEQSGHIVFAESSTTGDGILTAAMLMTLLAKKGQSLADVVGSLKKVPQVLISVDVADKTAAASSQALARSIDEAKRRLGNSGRLLVRPSGTEPVLRVMVEATDEDLAQSVAEEVASVIRAEEDSRI
jgi:phosphoglucosamine mutase